MQMVYLRMLVEFCMVKTNDPIADKVSDPKLYQKMAVVFSQVVQKRMDKMSGLDKTAQEHKKGHLKREKREIQGIVVMMGLINLNEMDEHNANNRHSLRGVNMMIARIL